MGKIISSKSRRPRVQMGDVVSVRGDAPQMGGFQHVRVGHEIARPVVLADGTKVLQTPNGRQFRVKRLSS